jgi:hypothetical protein
MEFLTDIVADFLDSGPVKQGRLRTHVGFNLPS